MRIYTFVLACVIGLQAVVAQRILRPESLVISASRADDVAALELKLHLEKITGTSIPLLVRHQARKGSYVLYVGRAPEAGTSFQPEEARWTLTDDGAWFYGEGQRGSLNAVYDFLESELGVRWPWGKEIACRPQNPLIIRRGEGRWIPSLNLRGIRTYSRPADSERNVWARRMRQGGHDQPSYGHAFTRYWKRFGASHPEYFAMRRDGVRGPVGMKAEANNAAAFKGQAGTAVAMCVSNESLVKQVIADWDKQSEYINLCENDAAPRDSCQCPACKALDVVPPGGEQMVWQNYYADRYIHFANRVLKEAQKIRPDVKVCMYAYNATEQAPSRERLLPNVVMGIVPTVFTKEAIRRYVGAWKKAGLNHFFYRPNRHVYYNLPQLPCGYERHFFDIWQFLYRNGAMGFDYDSGGVERGIHNWLSDYVIEKAMQDPSKSFEHWEQQYMESFGAAAADVKAYFLYWRTQVWEQRICPRLAEITKQGAYFNFARGLCWNLGTYYREKDFEETDRMLARAAKCTLTPVERSRVEAIRQANRHARLFFLAVARKSDENSMRLWQFRVKHGIEPIYRNEDYWGDITGVRRVMTFKDYMAPYLKTPLFWNFRLDPKDEGLNAGWQKQKTTTANGWTEKMPTNGTWEKPGRQYPFPSESMRRLTKDYDGIAWYACDIQVPKDWKQRKEIYLYFGAVDESCQVYLNGQKAGEHLFLKPNDWNVPFAIPIHSLIDWNKPKQTVMVRVEDKAGAGGIWKPVWLISR